MPHGIYLFLSRGPRAWSTRAIVNILIHVRWPLVGVNFLALGDWWVVAFHCAVILGAVHCPNRLSLVSMLIGFFSQILRVLHDSISGGHERRATHARTGRLSSQSSQVNELPTSTHVYNCRGSLLSLKFSSSKPKTEKKKIYPVLSADNAFSCPSFCLLMCHSNQDIISSSSNAPGPSQPQLKGRDCDKLALREHTYGYTEREFLLCS